MIIKFKCTMPVETESENELALKNICEIYKIKQPFCIVHGGVTDVYETELEKPKTGKDSEFFWVGSARNCCKKFIANNNVCKEHSVKILYPECPQCHADLRFE